MFIHNLVVIVTTVLSYLNFQFTSRQYVRCKISDFNLYSIQICRHCLPVLSSSCRKIFQSFCCGYVWSEKLQGAVPRRSFVRSRKKCRLFVPPSMISARASDPAAALLRIPPHRSYMFWLQIVCLIQFVFVV